MVVRLLGPLEACVDGLPVSLGGPRPRAILALLALSTGTTVTARRLVDTLWDGDPPQAAANTVQVYVSRLRRALTPAGAPSPLRATTGGYLLDLPTDAVDALLFDRLATEGHGLLAAGQADRAASALAGALRLWRGPALPDLAGLAGAEGVLARLGAQHLAVRIHRIDAEVARGRHAQVVPELEQLIRDHPLDEGLVARLMTALYLAGRQADALSAYGAAARRLSDELGVDPGPQLRQVQREVLRHEIEPLPPPPPAAPAWSPATVASDAGPATPRRPTPQPLLRPRGALIGRRRELALAIDLLRDPQVRVVTLLGPGGTGKTRLAVEIARALPGTATVDRPGPDVVMVPLAAVTDSGELLAEVCRALDAAPDWAGEPLLEIACRGLGGRSVVLVLDNLEQFVDEPSVVDDLVGLIDRVPELTVLCTSRTALHLRDERRLPLDPLPLPGEGAEDLDSVLGSDAVRLFLDRARAVLPGFEVTAANAAAVARVCRMLDGLPLAIELAAARVQILPPDQMLRRVGRRLQLLSGGPRDLPERHRSMRAALDWSAQLLDPVEAQMFAQLSAFSGGWTIEAAEAICAVGDPSGSDGGCPGEVDIVEVLARLVDRSLVSGDGTGRLAMLETIRDYAAEALIGRAELPGVRDRHARFYAELAAQLGPQCRTSPDSSTRSRLDVESGNLAAALEHASECGDGALLGRLVLGLLDYWYSCGRIGQADRWLDAVHAAQVPADLHTRLQMSAGSLAFVRGDLRRAATSFAAAVNAATELGDTTLLARALAASGAAARHAGDLEAALGRIDEALDVARRAELRALVPQLENERGELLDGLGRACEATPLFESYRQQALIDGDHSNLAWACGNLALQASEQGRDQDARDLAATALAAADSGGSAPVQGDARAIAGLLALRHGDPGEALALLRESLALTHAAGLLLAVPDTVSLIGAALLEAGHPEPAARMLVTGLAWRQARGLAVSGRLARQAVENAQGRLPAVLSPERLAAATERGTRVRYGSVNALQDLSLAMPLSMVVPEPGVDLRALDPPLGAERSGAGGTQAAAE